MIEFPQGGSTKKITTSFYEKIKKYYFILYRIEGNLVFIDNIFHELQDYENKIM